MILRNLFPRLRRIVPARFARDTRGAAALEFAIITPVILTLFFGASEVSSLVAADRKVTIMARTLSDLVAQSTTIANADMTNIFNASTSVLTPYSTTPLKMRVSAINIDSSGNTATVRWSDAQGTGITARSSNSVVTIPTALKVPNTQVIWSEIWYDYTSPTGQFIVGTVNLSDQFFARPRQSTTICRPPTVTTCS